MFMTPRVTILMSRTQVERHNGQFADKIACNCGLFVSRDTGCHLSTLRKRLADYHLVKEATDCMFLCM